MSTPTIHVRGLKKAFGQNAVLRGIDLDVPKGDVVVLMGPSGSGKTTCIRSLNFLETPDDGQIEVCGISIDCRPGSLDTKSARANIRAIRRKSAMVFQSFNLFPHLTALENVIEGPCSARKVPRAEAIERGRALLDRVGLSAKIDEYPARLSGGQKQRVAIARALAMDPEVILFDEPTSALDPELRNEVLSVMTGLAREGMTMVVVTHEIRFARDAATKVVFMDGGHVIEQNTPDRFFSKPDSERVRQFLQLVAQ